MCQFIEIEISSPPINLLNYKKLMMRGGKYYGAKGSIKQ